MRMELEALVGERIQRYKNQNLEGISGSDW
jgi:hypothetical protein